MVNIFYQIYSISFEFFKRRNCGIKQDGQCRLSFLVQGMWNSRSTL